MTAKKIKCKLTLHAKPELALMHTKCARSDEQIREGLFMAGGSCCSLQIMSNGAGEAHQLSGNETLNRPRPTLRQHFRRDFFAKSTRNEPLLGWRSAKLRATFS
jgi:hypothetical protein